MNNKKDFAKEYFKKIADLGAKISLEEIDEVMGYIDEAHCNGKTIFVAGNGGSAATASHMVCDLCKTTLGKDNVNSTKKRFKVVSLTDNVPLLTALGNDCSYDVSFSEYLKTFAGKDDLLLVITGSGNSKNIIEAINVAKKIGMKTVGFLGFDGGKCLGLLDASILIPANEYGPIEDYHMILDHMMTAYYLSEIK